MNINSDINILGSLPDWNLIPIFFSEDSASIRDKGGVYAYTSIKTVKSVSRFERAIKATFLHFIHSDIESLFRSMLNNKGMISDTLLFLFWNASQNNDLLNYINETVYFPAFYSGRVSIRHDEVIASIKDLKQSEIDLQKWSENTIVKTASKYLTLMKKFGLMSGSINKTIVHPYLTDEMFIIFIYWLAATSEKSNVLKGKLLQYSFSELQPFLDRLLQKKFSKYYNVVYTGDKLNIETLIPYELIYEYINKS